MKRDLTATDRREFLTHALVLAGGCVACGLFAGCETDVLKSSNVAVQFDIAGKPALAQVGGAVAQTFDGQNGGAPVLIIRESEEKFLALSSVCTHQGCYVNVPGANDAEISCPCHGSRYSKATGQVIQGPAPAPLPRFDNVYDKGSQILTISF